MANTEDALDDGFHEIQLSGKQLVFAFMAATSLAVAIFLLGVRVGRGVKSDRAGSDAVDTVASAEPPAASTPSQPAPSSSGPPAAEPPAPAQDDELSYAKRLQGGGNTAAKETVKPPTPVESRPPSQPPAAVASAGPQSPPAAKTPAAPAGGASAQGNAGQWIVQLTALQDRNAAAAFAKRLAAKGYPAFVLDPAPGAPVIYRVQVGGFPDRDKADQINRKLEREEQIKGYVRSR